MSGKRYLVVTADDFGIGPATSEGILALAAEGHLTSTLLLVNSPHARAAVAAWQRAGRPVELGWHPCLTLDRPVLSPVQVPTLVRPDGQFWPLGAFLVQFCLGRIRAVEVQQELEAQLQRFRDLVGGSPVAVGSHHHVQVLPPIGAVLRRLLRQLRPQPYLRRVRETWPMLMRVPGARMKRLFLTLLGRHDARKQVHEGFPGNDWLAGVTDPVCVSDPDYLGRWLRWVPGRVVELSCHPGYLDTTLAGRDFHGARPGDGQLMRRVRELQLLREASFAVACRQAGFTLVRPSCLAGMRETGVADAA